MFFLSEAIRLQNLTTSADASSAKGHSPLLIWSWFCFLPSCFEKFQLKWLSCFREWDWKLFADKNQPNCSLQVPHFRVGFWALKRQRVHGGLSGVKEVPCMTCPWEAKSHISFISTWERGENLQIWCVWCLPTNPPAGVGMWVRLSKSVFGLPLSWSELMQGQALGNGKCQSDGHG